MFIVAAQEKLEENGIRHTHTFAVLQEVHSEGAVIPRNARISSKEILSLTMFEQPANRVLGDLTRCNACYPITGDNVAKCDEALWPLLAKLELKIACRRVRLNKKGGE